MKALDNGTLLALGLVGVVAAAGAVTKRGSTARRASFDVGDTVTFDAGMGVTRTVFVTHKDYDDDARAPYFLGRDADGKTRSGSDDKVISVVRAGAKGSRTVVGSLAALTQMDRARLPARDFVFPEDRSYPIHDYRHGQLALTYAATPSNRLRRYRVMQAVFARYPKLQAWWNTTDVGKRDPANINSWRTTLHQYQAALPRLTDPAERAETAAEIDALLSLSGRARRAA